MSDQEFRAILDWWMCSDPFPANVDRASIEDWLNRESQARGYDGIIAAFHGAPKS